MLSKTNTGYSLPTPSRDDNSVLLKSLLDQIEYLKKELSRKSNTTYCLSKYGKPILVGNQTSHNSNSDEIIENSSLDSDVTNPNVTSINQDRNVTDDIDFTIDNNNDNDVSENSKCTECAETQLSRILKQLQDVRAEQHSNYLTYRNKEGEAWETKNRSLIVDVDLGPENISAKSTKESKGDDSPKEWPKGATLTLMVWMIGFPQAKKSSILGPFQGQWYTTQHVWSFETNFKTKARLHYLTYWYKQYF